MTRTASGRAASNARNVPWRAAESDPEVCRAVWVAATTRPMCTLEVAPCAR